MTDRIFRLYACNRSGANGEVASLEFINAGSPRILPVQDVLLLKTPTIVAGSRRLQSNQGAPREKAPACHRPPVCNFMFILLNLRKVIMFEALVLGKEDLRSERAKEPN
jgi:hypothetical protein